MSDDHGNKSSVNWGGLIKTVVAGAAVLIGVNLVTGGMITDMFKSDGGDGLLSKLFKDKDFLKGMGDILARVGGVILAGIGLSYLFSDKSQHENAERHAQNFADAKESFQIREDMKKMQKVMLLRQQNAGFEPAMSMGGPAPGC